MRKAVWFIAGVGFILRGMAGEYVLSPYLAVGVILLVIGVISLFRKPKAKISRYDKTLEDIHNNRPIKL